MSISTAPAPTPPPKKRGMGCFGCGCAFLVLLVILFFGLLGALGFGLYKSAHDFTSDTPTTIPSFTGTDDFYQSARQKLADFDHDVMNHQAATVQFSGDEINSLLSHNPDIAQNHIQTFVSFTNNEARIQAAFPTDAITRGMMTGRYSSFDATFEVHFDQVTQSVELIPHKLQLEDKAILGGDADDQQSQQALVRALTPFLNLQFNTAIRKSSDGAMLLKNAKSIEVQGGQLVLETR